MNLTSAKPALIGVAALVVSLIVAEAIASVWVSSKVETILARQGLEAAQHPDISELLDRYGDRLHHIRAPQSLPDGAPAREMLYTELSAESSSRGGNLLLQGDSWAERASNTMPMLRKISMCSELGMVLAGTSSYSPTTMAMQLLVLREDFKVKPNVVIAIIDQTDIGDEFYRYTTPLIEDGRLVSVAPPGTLEQQRASRKALDDIYLSDGFALEKLFRRSVENVKRQSQPRDSYSIRGETILGPLKNGLSRNEEERFLRGLAMYTDVVFQDPGVKNLIFVTHPHQGHVRGEGQYKGDVRPLVARFAQTSKHGLKIKVLSVPLAPEHFLDSDPFSHLTDDAYRDVYYPFIFRNFERTAPCLDAETR